MCWDQCRDMCWGQCGTIDGSAETSAGVSAGTSAKIRFRTAVLGLVLGLVLVLVLRIVLVLVLGIVVGLVLRIVLGLVLRIVLGLVLGHRIYIHIKSSVISRCCLNTIFYAYICTVVQWIKNKCAIMKKHVKDTRKQRCQDMCHIFYRTDELIIHFYTFLIIRYFII